MARRWWGLGAVVLWAAGCGVQEQPEPPPQPPAPVAVCPGAPVANAAPDGTAQATPQQAPRYLVRLRPGVRALVGGPELTLEKVGARLERSWPRLDLISARLSEAQARALAAQPDVLSVSPDRPVHALGTFAPWGAALRSAAVAATPGSGLYSTALRAVQAPQVWDVDGDGVLDQGAPSGAGVKVCVVDSGWDDRQPELAGAVVGGKDFVDGDDQPLDFDATKQQWGGGHGTHVAGTIAARLGADGQRLPGQGLDDVAGVAPGVQLLIARVLDTRGNGSTADVISALAWCQAQGARVASLSLGSSNSDEDEKAAVADAVAHGMLVVAASGNSGGTTPEPPIAYPAGYPAALAVGAVDGALAHPAFSQVGPELALVAPGVDVLSSYIVGAAPFSRLSASGQPLASRVLEYSGMGAYTGTLVDCGIADASTPCGTGATCDGFVAYVTRGGGVTFADKVRHVQAQGARAVVVGNHDAADDASLAFTLGAPGAWPGVAVVPTTEVARVRALLGQPVTLDVAGADYARETGTSMATPHVSGVAALLLSERPSLTVDELRGLLQDSARDLGPAGRDPAFGYGLVQAADALTLLRARFPR